MPDNISDDCIVEEVSALSLYAANRGIGANEDLFQKLDEALIAYQDASDGDKPKKRGELLAQYAALVKRTAPVNGRTLLETQKSRSTILPLMLVTFYVLFLAVANEGSAVWFAELPEPEEGLERILFQIRNSFLEFLSPFIWGALGACVFMMTRLYRIVKDQQFDSAKLTGWYLRLMLGAILGAVVANVYDATQLGGDAQDLDADVLAFFAGLGVKVVYGAFERTIEVLSEKLNLGAARRRRPPTADARAAFARKLTEVDKDKEPEKYQAIVEMIEELEREARQG